METNNAKKLIIWQDTPLQVNIGGESYFVAEPTILTFIKASGLLAELGRKGGSNDAATELLNKSRESAILSETLALLILGDGIPLNQTKLVFLRLYWKVKQDTPSKEEMAEKIIKKLSQEELIRDITVIMKAFDEFLNTSALLIEENLRRWIKGK